MRRLALLDHLRHHGRHFGHAAADFARRRSQRLEIPARGRERAPAANEFHAPELLHALELAHQNQPHLPGARRMRSTTRLDVETFNLENPQRSFAFHFLANTQTLQFFLFPKTYRDGTVIENHAVRQPLGLRQVTRHDARRIEIDRANLAAQVKRDRREMEQFQKRGREQMLPRVLLNMVEASLPIDRAVHRAGKNGPVGDVDDFVVVLTVVDVDDGCFAEAAGVVRLSARGRIERRPVEQHFEAPVTLLARNDLGVEFPQN